MLSKLPKFDKKDIPHLIMIIISSFIYSCGIVLFVRSGNLFPGGFSGIARLISLIFHDYLNINLSFSIIYFALNTIVTVLVMRRIGPKFLIYSVFWYTLTSFFTAIMKLPFITEDILLISVFGGVISGIAMGIAHRANASSAGTDFIAIDLAIRFNRPTWNYIFILNVIVLSIAGLLYGWNTALYSMIYQFVANEVVKALHQRYTSSSIQIITDKADEISKAIFEICDHGITKVPCEGVYSHENHDLLLMTVNTYQLKDIEKCVKEIDPHAFMTIDTVKKVVGNYHQEPLE